MPIRAALVDLDGTIWDNPVRFAAVREALGLPLDGRPILHGIRELPQEDQPRALALLAAHEQEGVTRGTLRPGAEDLLRFLRAKGVKTALVTNNSRASAEAVLARHPLPFDLVLTRDDGPVKPDPEAFLLPLRRWCIPPREALVLGDSHLDLQAAHGAGIPRVVLVRPPAWSRAYFPPGAPFVEVPDLPAGQALIARLLK
ncbi:MAG: HAD family hydrolase [Candidatus Bipolaricaulota bacterium]|nr:HAD family hydrolase [Candidatus Bipolaricaulota bacterium]